MILPIKILYTIPNFITAGSGRAMLNIIERLDFSRFSPAVCVLRKGGDLDSEVERLGIPFLEAPFIVPAMPRYSLLKRAWDAAKFFRPYRFDLWHSFHYGDDYTEPIIARMAGASAWTYTKKNMNWHLRSWKVRSLLATSIAVQNTDMLKDFFAHPIFRRKAMMIPRGVDSSFYHPCIKSKLNLRNGLGIKQGQILIGIVAHMVPSKGIEILIQAMKSLSNAHAVIAGKSLDAEYTKMLKDLTAELEIQDRIHFVGNILDIASFLSEIDIFVLSTNRSGRGEGSPVSLLEAMACGCACVATDVPGTRDILNTDSKAGILVPPSDAMQLGEALQRLIASPETREELKRSARKLVLESYTIEREVRDHEKFYSDIFFRKQRSWLRTDVARIIT